MARRFDSVKHDDWCRRFKKFDSSGLTVVEFCRREQVSQASFYYWSRRIRGRDRSETVECQPSDALSGTSPRQQERDVVEVLVGDSIRVRMPAAEPAAVVALIKQLLATSAVADGSAAVSRFQRIELSA